MPAPEKGESESGYVSRFMESAEARKDYPDEKQRAAVAYSMYREKYKVKNCVTSLPSEKSTICKVCSGTCKSSKTALANQAQFGVMFKGNHLEPGLVRYDDITNPITNEKGMTLLVDRDGIEALRKSFTGKPVYNFMHSNDVKPEDISNGKAIGVVAGNVYNAETGWDDVTYMVWDSQAVENCKNGKFALSCSYIPAIDGVPGVYHNMPYDAKVIGGEYEHLAIVPNPRYEGSKIAAVNNSKGETKMAESKVDTIVSKIKMLFKIGGVDNSVEVDTASKVKVGEAEVSLSDLMAAHVTLENSKAQAAAEAAAVQAMSDETIVTLENGKTATVAEMKASFTALKNEADEKAAKEKSEKEEKEAKEKKDGEEKVKAENAAAELAKKTAEAVEIEKAHNAIKVAAETRPLDNAAGIVEGPQMQSDRLAAGSRI